MRVSIQALFLSFLPWLLNPLVPGNGSVAGVASIQLKEHCNRLQDSACGSINPGSSRRCHLAWDAAVLVAVLMSSSSLAISSPRLKSWGGIAAFLEVYSFPCALLSVNCVPVCRSSSRPVLAAAASSRFTRTSGEPRRRRR